MLQARLTGHAFFALWFVLVGCARTGFQQPPRDSGSLVVDAGRTDAPALDVPPQDSCVDATASDGWRPDVPASDTRSLDAATADRDVDASLALDATTRDSQGLDGSSDAARADSNGVDAAVADVTTLDQTSADSTAPDSAIADSALPDTNAMDSTQPDAAIADSALPDSSVADSIQPDTAVADSSLPDATIADSAAAGDASLDAASAQDAGGCARTPPWWNPDYSLRRPLRITENIAGSLATGYSVVLRYDSSLDVNAARCLPTGDDVRVVRWDGATWTELDRHLRQMDSTTTEIWFKTPASITGSDVSTWLYLDNPGAGLPPASWVDGMAGTSAVYLAADDFESYSLGGLAAQSAWEGSTAYRVVVDPDDASNQILELASNPPSVAGYLFAGSYSWTDIAIRGRLNMVKAQGKDASYVGFWLRAPTATNFWAAYSGYFDPTTVEHYRCHLSSATATGLDTSPASVRTGTTSVTRAKTWHEEEAHVRGDRLEHFLDGSSVLSTPSAGVPANGRVGLCYGYTQGTVRWDDIVVRALVNPEPVVSVDGLDEVGCP
ncbi:MAG: hypothetical protein ABIJ09_00265 [Pseudomonadota bacterium]